MFVKIRKNKGKFLKDIAEALVVKKKDPITKETVMFLDLLDMFCKTKTARTVSAGDRDVTDVRILELNRVINIDFEKIKPQYAQLAEAKEPLEADRMIGFIYSEFCGNLKQQEEVKDSRYMSGNQIYSEFVETLVFITYLLCKTGSESKDAAILKDEEVLDKLMKPFLDLGMSVADFQEFIIDLTITGLKEEFVASKVVNNLILNPSATLGLHMAVKEYDEKLDGVLDEYLDLVSKSIPLYSITNKEFKLTAIYMCRYMLRNFLLSKEED